MIEDLTHLVERSLPHERRCGVVLEGLYAVAERDDDGTRLIINGELHAVDGPAVPGWLRMTAMVSDPQGRLLAADEHIIDPDEFYIFDPFSFRIRFPGPVDFGRIRVLPRA